MLFWKTPWSPTFVSLLLTTLQKVSLGKVHLIWQEGDEDIEEGLRRFLDTRKGGSGKFRGGSENLYTLNPKGGGGGGAPKKLNH